ncbi:HNH endonuclease [Methermicoccus shengliensis]|uniref:HNH endonuclease n=1 Tax=Methermicoccus shengliensis TaxID=660064 RepID=UPI0005B29254|nr:HNH endonuclease [Methermicoccus shengliensis]
MTHREPTEEEKRTIIAQHTRDGKVRCYVNDHPIEDEGDIEFHHIKPFSEEGKTEISNLAPVCKEHHRRIRTLSITEFRTRLEMEEFFKSPEPRKLDDVLKKKIGDGNFGKNLTYEILDKGIKLFLQDRSEPMVLSLYTCPSTGYKYFYVTLPVMYIQNDTELQPRPIEMRRLWELYRHLLTHTQLSPAICRLKDNKILLFDGQHKSAAQIWCGRKEIECKVYIEPDVRILKETNLAAHDKLRQMQFFTSVLISKWADLFKEEWGEYLETKGIKSEKGFVEFLERKGKKKSEALNMIRSNIYDSVLDDKDNRIVDYIAERNRTRKNPLTIHSLKQTIFKHFITDAPLDMDIEQSDELREYERKNVIKLLNILAEETLDGKWDPTRNDSSHKVAERIYAAGSLKAWTRMLRDVTAAVLRLYDEDERGKIFLRKISEDDWNLIRGRITRLFEHKLWTDPSPEIDSNLRVNNEKHVKEFFESRGLKVDWILGG